MSALPAHPDELEIAEFLLDNGLRLFVHPDNSSPVVSIQAWVGAGSLTEGIWSGSGLSHFLEHMLFKGTARRSGSEFAHGIQDLGGYLNAYTSFDRTVYYADLPASGWKPALDLLSDAVFRSTLPEEEFAKEQEVIRREFAMGADDPDRELQKLFFRTAFTVHPYRHPIIGHLDLFNRITHADLTAYYQQRYTTGNITWVVAGDVNPLAVRDELERLTRDLPRREAAPVYIPTEPLQIAPRRAVQPFPTEVTRFYYGFPIPGASHPDTHALDLLALLAGQGRSSRLHRRLVENPPLLRAVEAFSYTPAQAGLWAVAAVCHPQNSRTVDELRQTIHDLLEEFATTPVEEAELAKARRQATASRASELKTVAGRAASIGSGWFTARDPHFGDIYLHRISRVTAGDIQRVASTYLRPAASILASLEPARPAPSTAIPASPAAGRNMELATLSNGLRVVLVADPRLPLATLRVLARGGQLLDTPEQAGWGRLAARLADKGCRCYSAAAWAEAVESLGGHFHADFGNNSVSLSVETLASEWSAAAGLLAAAVLTPDWPQDELEKERKKQQADLSMEADQPMAVARNHLRLRLFGSHPYALNSLGSPGSLSGATLDALRSRHALQYQPGNMILAVSGRFDRAECLARLESLFGSLPPHSTPVFPGPPDFPTAPVHEEVPLPKQQAVIQIAFPGIGMAHPFRPALELLDEALSDLGSRLFVRIREEQALAYFVGSSQMIGADRGYFLLYAGTDPAKADHARNELLDEARLLAREGLSDGEIERARAKLVGHKLLQDQSAASVAYRAALNELHGLGHDYEHRFMESVAALDGRAVREAAAWLFSQPSVSVTVHPPA
jgi:zinc protease